MENLFNSSGVTESAYESKTEHHTAKGIQFNVPMEDKNYSVIMITEADYGVPTPYIYSNDVGFGNDKLKEQIFGKVIGYEAEKGNEWAIDVKQTTIDIWTSILENSQTDKDINYLLNNGDSVYFTPCTVEYGKPIKSLDDVEYYLVHSQVLDGGGTIFDLSTSVVNADKAKECHEQSKKALLDFYKENIYPYKDIPYSERSEELKENYGMYSDWHKDIFGYRPNTDAKDEGLQAMKNQKVKGKEIKTLD